jgi:hypothetical protein
MLPPSLNSEALPSSDGGPTDPSIPGAFPGDNPDDVAPSAGGHSAEVGENRNS